MEKYTNSILALVSLFMLTLTACQKEDVSDDLPIANKIVHIHELAQSIEDQLGPGCVGLQYTISQDGVKKTSNAIGFSRLNVDGGEIGYTIQNRKSVHSMSKTITAAAMIHALNKFNVDLNASISPYFPERWNLNVLVNGITFKQLMSHISGLRGIRDSLHEMKAYLEAGNFSFKGAINDGKLGERYANVNYTLMRLLIPMVDPELNATLNSQYNIGGDAAFDVLAATSYIEYVRENILIANEISDDVAPLIWDNPAINTYHYNYENQSAEGYIHTNQTLFTGAGGWYMNTEEYSAFLAFLLHGEIPGINLEDMINGHLGFFTGTRLDEEIYRHNGASGFDPDGRGGRADWIHFPETDVTVVIQINSANNDFTVDQSANMIVQAYKDAYH